MKFLLKTLFVLIVVNLLIVLLFNIKNKNNLNNYKVDSYEITSRYEENKYNYTIKREGLSYSFYINNEYKKNKNMITNVYEYKGDIYTCILPTIDNNIIFDFVCTVDNEYFYYYYDIYGLDKTLDSKIKGNNIENYNINVYRDNSYKIINNTTIIYKDNIDDNLYLSISNYKGLTVLNGNDGDYLKDISIFNNDYYKQKLKIFYDEFYIIADYNSKYYFDKFYKVNFIENSIDEIKLRFKISFDSIIQGVIDNKLYILDFNDKIQYELNLKTNEINIIGTIEKKFKYYNAGQWIQLSYNNIKEKPIFNLNDNYLYKESNGYYNVYQQFNNTKLYMFKTNNINRIVKDQDDIYYIEDGHIKKFNTISGKKTIYYTQELMFNEDIIFNVKKKQ